MGRLGGDGSRSIVVFGGPGLCRILSPRTAIAPTPLDSEHVRPLTQLPGSRVPRGLGDAVGVSAKRLDVANHHAATSGGDAAKRS